MREIVWFDLVSVGLFVGSAVALAHTKRNLDRSKVHLEEAERRFRHAQLVHKVHRAQLSEYQALVEKCVADGLPWAVFMARLRVASADQRADFERRLAAEMEAER